MKALLPLLTAIRGRRLGARGGGEVAEAQEAAKTAAAA